MDPYSVADFLSWVCRHVRVTSSQDTFATRQPSTDLNNIYRRGSMEVGWGISPDYTSGQRTINNMIFERRESEPIPGKSLPEVVSPETILTQTIKIDSGDLEGKERGE